jgi:hypothetical protein
MNGYYIEAGYDVFAPFKALKTQLIPFIRFESYDTHHKVESNIVRNPSYKYRIITSGLGWKMLPGAIFKADLQFMQSDASDTYLKFFNAGLGVMF